MLQLLVIGYLVGEQRGELVLSPDHSQALGVDDDDDNDDGDDGDDDDNDDDYVNEVRVC